MVLDSSCVALSILKEKDLMMLELCVAALVVFWKSHLLGISGSDGDWMAACIFSGRLRVCGVVGVGCVGIPE